MKTFRVWYKYPADDWEYSCTVNAKTKKAAEAVVRSQGELTITKIEQINE